MYGWCGDVTSGGFARAPLSMVLDYKLYQFLEDITRLAV